jgi:hypothetical protein
LVWNGKVQILGEFGWNSVGGFKEVLANFLDEGIRIA